MLWYLYSIVMITAVYMNSVTVFNKLTHQLQVTMQCDYVKF